jgi:hypothetical protein
VALIHANDDPNGRSVRLLEQVLPRRGIGVRSVGGHQRTFAANKTPSFRNEEAFDDARELVWGEIL